MLILLFPTQRNAFLKEVAALQTTLQQRERELALVTFLLIFFSIQVLLNNPFQSRAESRLAQEEVASANAVRPR